MMTRALKPLLALLLIGMTASCYLPNKFTLTMQVAPDGRYSVSYDGTLTQLQLLQRIGAGELKGAQIDEYVNIYESELRRRTGFKEVTYRGRAEYQVKFERQGSLARERQFSFPTRQGVLMGLRRWTAETAAGYMSRFEQMGHPALFSMREAGFQREPNIMEIFGDKLPQRIRADLEANGWWIQGSIRIWSDAKIGYHNAQQVVPGSPTLYIWDVNDLDTEPPHMIMAWTPPSS